MDKIVLKNIRDLYLVKYNNIIYQCKLKGTLRKDRIDIKAGDIVDIDTENRLITNVLKRKNTLTRPPISNVDQALIVISAKEPELSTLQLDKMLDII